MASTDRSTIVSIFSTREQAERAVRSLRSAGIPDSSIGMVSPDERDVVNGMQQRLVGLGVSEDRAAYYQRELESGKSLVAVHADAHSDQWRATLRRLGGLDRPDHAQDPDQTVERSRITANDAGVGSADEQSLPLREERLVGETTRRDAGEVVVRKVLEEVPVRKTVDRNVEGVDVQRVRVDEIVTGRRAPWQEGDTFVVPLYEERLIVQRQLVHSESLHIRRVVKTERQQIEGTVRRERAIIDDPDHHVRDQTPQEDGQTASGQTSRDDTGNC